MLNMILKLCVVVLVLTGGVLVNAASTVWDPAANDIYPPSQANWSDWHNWTQKVVPGDFKVVFKVSGAADCIVNNTQTATQLVQGDNGPGGMICIKNGGNLTAGTTPVWTSIGYNNTAKVLVEQGGVFSVKEHLWIGFTAGAIGTLQIDGGVVNVAQMIGLGWSGGTGYINLNDGVLNLKDIHATDSIKGDSVIDIELGVIIIDGNKKTIIDNYIQASRITAYDGTGKVYCDYNATNTGKTTVWAEPAEIVFGTGDINADNFIDILDLQLFIGQWLSVAPGSEADLTKDQKVNMDDLHILAGNWHRNEYSKTLTGKIMCGYQGWFNTPTDGAGRGWVHWGSGGKFEPDYCTIDIWPDMSEYDSDEKYDTGFQNADGNIAQVFSSYNEKTVLRHFQWMQEYGIDGVFLQRFATETTPGSSGRSHRDQVMLHCRKGGNQYNRAWAMMYDISGLATGGTQRVIDDWKYLVDTFNVGQDPEDLAYLHHNGKPVIALWGIGFKDRAYTLDECLAMVNFFKNDPVYGGMTVMLGVPSYWRTLSGDCVSDPKVHEIILAADIVSPWAVGRYSSVSSSGVPTASGIDNYTNNVTAPDKIWCDSNSKEYLPVVFPGFSWQNLKGEKFDHIPRLGGRFLWHQIYKSINDAGVTMIYQAMFDEVDEGTAIFKCTSTPPVGPTPFLPIGNATYPPYDISDANLPSDHYLWLVGQATRMLTGEIPVTEAMPTR
ncbi:MAG: hypothetical protein JEZ07_11165 [Phycisphaerae bacterium]|nr:hypothetical protein [Phycisphaerae bacterium]